ncbi:ATP-binding protein [Cohnella thailandensis]|uniref:Circadian input-output histidine kinase CikA n=1 Tax=Cohnella thailandensis TaxID=557557 RepID=A0A841T2D7_9BACL|nr:ATP-binding protein [Cohnella thailandensis]MBB6637016.1 response regulator [Cohnella thailandensis]MBP1973100.1 signal transduction histidine kinase/DNA-binding NarL/FixJ family response regulator [Cohnella thailandensis]
MTRSLRLTMVAMFIPLLALSILFLFLIGWLNRDIASGIKAEPLWLFPLAASIVLTAVASLSYWVMRLKLQPILELEKQRKNERERRRSMMSASVHSVLLVDSAGRMRYVNPAAKRLFGIDHLTEEAIFIDEYLTTNSGLRMKQGIAEVMDTGYVSLSLELRRPDDSRANVDASLSLLSSLDCDNERCITVVMKDLSPQIRLAEEYKAAMEQAEQSNRSKSGFLARVSHEIRTPLHAVIGLSQLMDDSELGKQQQEYLSQIRVISRNLVRTLNDLLDFSKLESDKLSMENVEFRLEHTLDHLKHMMLALVGNKPISIRISKDRAVPDTLFGDPVRIEQVLYNLASNAIKFTDHGEIELLVELERGENNELYALYSVRDTGIGMTEQQLMQLFIPYRQVNSTLQRQYGGTGLGLVISKTLVELMGGQLEAASEHGQGSVFRFRLPMIGSCQESARGHAPRTGSSDGRLLDKLASVLLIEDHEISRMIASKMLRSLHCEVYEAENANEAFELLKDIGSRIDLVLMDLHMPGIDGISAVRTIRSFPEYKSIPIVIQTADTTMEQHNRCLAAGANEVLTKPVEMVHLKQVLERWIGAALREQAPASAPDPQASLKLEGLNVADAIVRVDGRIPFYVAMLTRFQERYRELIPALRRSLEAEEFAGTRRVLHTFRGAASHLSAQEVYAAATRLEDSLKTPREDRMALLDELDVQLQIVFQSIDKYKKSISLANISDTGGDLH